MNNTEINELVKPIAKRYGFEKASAEFTAYSDFKVRWTRSYTWIDMTVSDYLKKAPEGVIADVIELLLNKIKGIEAEYSDRTCEYLTSQEFRDENLKTFLKRKHFTAHPEADEIKKILEDEGVDIPDLKIVKGSGYESSALFRVLAVPEDYDEDKIRERADSIIEGMMMFKALP